MLYTKKWEILLFGYLYLDILSTFKVKGIDLKVSRNGNDKKFRKKTYLFIRIEKLLVTMRDLKKKNNKQKKIF